MLRSLPNPSVKEFLADTLSRAKRRLEAKGQKSEIKKFVNVAEGREGDPSLWTEVLRS